MLQVAVAACCGSAPQALADTGVAAYKNMVKKDRPGHAPGRGLRTMVQ